MTHIVSLPEPLRRLFNEIDKNKEKFINTLKEAIAIQSVSACPEKRNEVIRMTKWTQTLMQKLNIQTELREMGLQTLPDGNTIKLPPVIFGILGTDLKKKTVLIYGHIDVQPAQLKDGWDADPFVVTERDGKLYGRGVSDDKGPVLCWLHAVKSYQKLGIDIPVNIKFIFEAMEESGSVGLSELVDAERDKFLRDIDYVCISDTVWLGTQKPCIQYGLRGICCFCVEIECARKDIHSGLYGGAVHEAMTDLIYLLNTLVDKDGKIQIRRVYDDVAPLSKAESDIYPKIDFNVDAFREEIGCNKLLHDEKDELLMHRWRYPSLSIHGIEGAFSESGTKTVIPGKVTGKFSIRIVPNQTPELIEKYVLDYLDEKWKEYGSPNNMKARMSDRAYPWTEDPTHPHYTAGLKATKHVYNVEPDFVRDSGTIPVTLIFQRALGKNILMLPVGAADDGHHAQNETINIRNYIGGTKLLSAYLYEVAQLE